MLYSALFLCQMQYLINSLSKSSILPPTYSSLFQDMQPREKHKSWLSTYNATISSSAKSYTGEVLFICRFPSTLTQCAGSAYNNSGSHRARSRYHCVAPVSGPRGPLRSKRQNTRGIRRRAAFCGVWIQACNALLFLSIVIFTSSVGPRARGRQAGMGIVAVQAPKFKNYGDPLS